jgi:hypothetical protein
MFRRRRFVPATADPRERKAKYKQPPRDVLGDLANVPYIHPDYWQLESTSVIITEGEKKAAAIMAHLRIPAISIGGCWNWLAPDSQRVHDWISIALDRRAPELVTIIPDGDFRTR